MRVAFFELLIEDNLYI